MTEQEARKIIGEITLDRVSGEELEAINIAVKALEKQIPKEPIDKIMYKECPVCGAVDLGRYCMECGQAIKWE